MYLVFSQKVNSVLVLKTNHTKILFFFFSFSGRVSCGLGWPGAFGVAEDDFEVLVILHPLPQDWDYRSGPL